MNLEERGNLDCVEEMAWDLLRLKGRTGPDRPRELAKAAVQKATEGAAPAGT